MREIVPEGIVVGIDEVGRGALAGPLMVACVALPDDPQVIGLDDSKKLSPKRRAELAEQIDEECNQPEALWFNDFRIYLTKNFLVSVYGGKLTALDLAKVRLTRLFETVKGSMNVITLEVTTTEQEKITVSENEWSFFTMNEEEITYLTDVFGKRNIEFVCEIQPDEEIDEDEEF